MIKHKTIATLLCAFLVSTLTDGQDAPTSQENVTLPISQENVTLPISQENVTVAISQPGSNQNTSEVPTNQPLCMALRQVPCGPARRPQRHFVHRPQRHFVHRPPPHFVRRPPPRWVRRPQRVWVPRPQWPCAVAKPQRPCGVAKPQQPWVFPKLKWPSWTKPTTQRPWTFPKLKWPTWGKSTTQRPWSLPKLKWPWFKRPTKKVPTATQPMPPPVPIQPMPQQPPTSSGNMKIVVNSLSNIIALLNQRINTAIVFDFTAKIVLLMDGNNGDVITIDAQSQTGYRTTRQTSKVFWLSIQVNFEVYIKALPPLRKLLPFIVQAGTPFNLNSADPKIMQIVTQQTNAFGVNNGNTNNFSNPFAILVNFVTRLNVGLHNVQSNVLNMFTQKYVPPVQDITLGNVVNTFERVPMFSAQFNAGINAGVQIGR